MKKKTLLLALFTGFLASLLTFAVPAAEADRTSFSLVGSWGLVSIGNKPGDASNSTWTFYLDGTYDLFFVAEPLYPYQSGTGNYTLTGSTLYVDGVVANNLIAGNTVNLAIYGNNTMFSFPDDEGDIWTYNRISGGGGSEAPVLSNPAANPDEITNDGVASSVLTVNVSDPDGDLGSVAIDLSPLGGSPSQAMYDDGTNGDATAGDGIYSIQTTAAASTSVGQKSLTVIATDQAGNTGSSFIYLSITQVITDTVQPQATNIHTIINDIDDQTLVLKYSLVGASSYEIQQAAAVTMEVKDPGGDTYAQVDLDSTENTLTIANAEAGTWTLEVTNQGSTESTYRIETVAGGTGIIVGTITDITTQTNLSGVTIMTGTGGAALSVNGNYVLVSVAGTFTVSASYVGYQSQSVTNVTVNAGETVTVDFSLGPATIEYVQLVALNTNLRTTPQMGDQIAFIAETTGPTSRYCRFLYKAGYGTQAWSTNQWVTLQNLSSDNTATFTFPSADNYLFIVQASDDENTWIAGDPQGGITVKVSDVSDVQLLRLAANFSNPVNPGDPVTFTAVATGMGTMYYRFLYKAGYGTEAWSTNQWVTIQNLSADNAATFSFPSADNYCIIVQASDDGNVWIAGDPQGGMTMKVEGQ